MSAVMEVALLQALSQALQASKKFCEKAGPLVTSPTAKLAYLMGAELSEHLGAIANAGLDAANSEFATINGAEKDFVTALAGIPPIA